VGSAGQHMTRGRDNATGTEGARWFIGQSGVRLDCGYAVIMEGRGLGLKFGYECPTPFQVGRGDDPEQLAASSGCNLETTGFL
jgi:hypothetical protein